MAPQTSDRVGVRAEPLGGPRSHGDTSTDGDGGAGAKRQTLGGAAAGGHAHNRHSEVSGRGTWRQLGEALGGGAGHGDGAESRALSSSCRAEDPQHCAEGKGFLQKSSNSETHFTDVSRATRGGWGAGGTLDSVMRCSAAAVGG